MPPCVCVSIHCLYSKCSTGIRSKTAAYKLCFSNQILVKWNDAVSWSTTREKRKERCIQIDKPHLQLTSHSAWHARAHRTHLNNLFVRSKPYSLMVRSVGTAKWMYIGVFYFHFIRSFLITHRSHCRSFHGPSTVRTEPLTMSPTPGPATPASFLRNATFRWK